MKRIFIIALILVCCNVSAWAQTCTINGKMGESKYQNKMIFLKNMNTGDTLATTILKDGVFSFQVDVKEPFVGYMGTARLAEGGYYYSYIIVEPGAIYVDMVTDSLSGTPLNDAYNEYMRNNRLADETENEMIAKVDAAPDSLKNGAMFTMAFNMYALEKLRVDMSKELYEKNKDNALGALAFYDYIENAELKYEQVMELTKDLSPIVLSYQRLQSKLEAMASLAKTAVGAHYTDLELTAFDTQKKVKLSDYVEGKVALVDFWAAWCRPCRAEIPNIAEIYKKYAAQGLVVIGLNVWDEYDRQAKAIKDLNMTWIQLTDSTKNATDVYGVSGIPHIMLIGKDGRIVARDLRGEDIEKAVMKALAE